MKKIILILLILSAGAALRFYNLGEFSLWHDEAYGVLQAEIPNEVIAENAGESPLYIFFIHFWKGITDSEFGLRMSSLVFGLVSIFMVYLLGRSLFNEKIALVSAFLLAVSPFHIYYSQEVKVYSLITLLTLFSVYFLIKYVHSKKKLFLLGYIIFNLLNIYCHYIGLFVWLAQIVFLFLICDNREKQFKKMWVISNLAILLLFLPWIIFLLTWMKKVLSSPLGYSCLPFWPPAPTLNSIFMTFKNFSIGYSASRTVYTSAVIIFFFLFFKGIFPWKNKRSIVLCLLCLSIPILSFFEISRIGSIYIDRYFIASSVFYYYIVAAGLVSFNKKISVSICMIILALSLFSLKSYYKNSLSYRFEERVGVQRRKDHRGIAQYIANRIKEGDRVYHTCRNTVFPFIYYFNKANTNTNNDSYSVCLSLLDKGRLRLFKFNMFGQREDVSKILLKGTFKRTWLVFSTWDFDKLEPKSKEWITVKFMNKRYKNIGYKRFEGAVVYLYEAGNK